MRKKETKIFDVIIIGAGASGMMAAVTAARRGLSVLLVEHMDKAGKKLYATGNGRCNFTNAVMDFGCYYGDEKLLQVVLPEFTNEDTLAFFHEIGIYPKELNGYYYPNSMQAASVVEAFVAELEKCDVTLMLNCSLQSLECDNNEFLVKTNLSLFRGKNVIFATGLCAAPKLGSDGFALQILKEMGHHFTPVLPVLCGFYAKGLDFNKTAGVRCAVKLTLSSDGTAITSEHGELQMTDYGISGIPVFQISSPAVRSLHEKKKTVVTIDFLPDLSLQEVKDELLFRFHRNPALQTVPELLVGLLNSKLAAPLAKRAEIVQQKLNELSIHKLASVIHECPVTLTKIRDFSFAQACTGGICTDEIHTDTLESRLVPHLYFAGEILDVDGICGGYNLQWAWASGYVAGNAVGK